MPLLIVSRDISAETREALLAHRLQDAAKRLMEEHGLSCVEAEDLLNIAVYKDGRVMRSAKSLLAALVLVSSLIAGCGCIAADSYGNPACQKYHTNWPFNPGWDD